MKTGSLKFAAITAFLTVITLVGSVWVFLVILGPNSVSRVKVIPSDSLGFLLLFIVFPCGSSGFSGGWVDLIFWFWLGSRSWYPRDAHCFIDL